MTTSSTYYRRASMPASSLANRRQYLTPTTCFQTGYSSNLQDYRQTGRVFSRTSIIRPSTALLCDSWDNSNEGTTKLFERNLPTYQKSQSNLLLEGDAGRYKNSSNTALKYKKTYDPTRCR